MATFAEEILNGKLHFLCSVFKCITGNLVSSISDHHAKFLTLLNYATTQNSKKDIYRRNFKHFDSKKIIKNLVKENWDNTLNILESNTYIPSKCF